MWELLHESARDALRVIGQLDNSILIDIKSLSNGDVFFVQLKK